MAKKKTQSRPSLYCIILACFALYAFATSFQFDTEAFYSNLTNANDGDTWACPHCDKENFLWLTGCNECGTWRGWDK